VSLVVCNEFECDTTTYSGMITISPCLGLPSLEELGLTLYPNPTEKQVAFKGYIEGDLQLELISVDGQVVLTTVGNIEELTKSLNQQLLHIQRGLYVIRIGKENTFWSQRLLLR
jgi:hypothetical protein